MRLLGYEWSKLARLPALWGFLALCLAFNCLLIGSGDRWRWEWNETAAMTGGLGQRVDTHFLDGLRQQPQSEYQDYLLSAAEGMSNTYADYDLKALSSFYNGYVKSSPAAAALMGRKYERLEERVAHLSETGAAMDWYGGPITHYVHQFLYGTLMRAVLTEGAVLGVLSMLFLLGYENQQRTAAGVYASRTGRRLCRCKVLAGITWSLALYLLLAAVTLGIFLLFWDWVDVKKNFHTHEKENVTQEEARLPGSGCVNVLQRCFGITAAGTRVCPRGGDGEKKESRQSRDSRTTTIACQGPQKIFPGSEEPGKFFCFPPGKSGEIFRSLLPLHP